MLRVVPSRVAQGNDLIVGDLAACLGRNMEIGIGLPSTIPGIRSDLILDWARKADAGPFSSVGVIDRLVYASHEAMVSLAAVAPITQRVRLVTSLIQAPMRNAGILAKQAATLDALSGGRLTLGLGVGQREDDFRAAPAALGGRGRRFEEQLALMKKIWSGAALEEGVGPVGPPPAQQGGPELLIGGRVPEAIRRVGRWADGYVGAQTEPAGLRQFYDVVEESWREAGRTGKPRYVGLFYFALTPDSADRTASYLRRYYGYMGPGVEHFVQLALWSPQRVKDAMRDYSAIGMDEALFFPCVPELEEVDRLADLVG